MGEHVTDARGIAFINAFEWHMLLRLNAATA
jgi:hypothetical protein